MARSSRIRKPTAVEVKQLHRVIETSPDKRQRRRAEILILYVAGLTVTGISELLGLHVNTVSRVLQLFGRRGLATITRMSRGGAPRQISSYQITRIWRLADQSPSKQGLPYGRWSLAKLRDYVIHQRIVKQISREHLRRLLKKGAFVSNGCNANYSAMIRSVQLFWLEFAGFGGSCPGEAAYCFSM